MAKCETCKFDNVCDFSGIFRNNVRECRTYEQKEQQTWGNKIRSMSDEELAEWITKITDDAQRDARTKCDYQWAEWLKSEVKE